MSQQIQVQPYPASWLRWHKILGGRVSEVPDDNLSNRNANYSKQLWVCERAKKYFHITKVLTEGYQRHKFGNFSNLANCKWEFKIPVRVWILMWPQEKGKHCHRRHLFFVAKATHSLSPGRRDRLKPALNECVIWNLYHLNIYLEKIWKFEISQREPHTLTEFDEYQIKGKNSRTLIKASLKKTPDHEAKNSVSSTTHQSLNYQGWKKTYSSTTYFQKNMTCRRC